jgi:sugar phosphate isomerase/epimerase
VAAAAREDGWKVSGCSTPVFKCAVEDEAAIREHREIFKRSLEVAHTLQCDLLRVFTFLRQPDTLEPKRLARIREHLAGLVDLAKGSGVRVGVENEASAPTDLVRLMKIVRAAGYRGYLPIELLSSRGGTAPKDPYKAVPEFLAEVRQAIAATT